MRGDTVAIRDRLLAVVRDAGQPLTTNEVCDLAGPYLEERQHRDWMHRDPPHQWVTLVTCDGEREVVQCHLTCGQRGYQQLRWLEGKGLVERVWIDGQRTVRWLARGSEMADELAALEAIWVAS